MIQDVSSRDDDDGKDEENERERQVSQSCAKLEKQFGKRQTQMEDNMERENEKDTNQTRQKH